MIETEDNTTTPPTTTTTSSTKKTAMQILAEVVQRQKQQQQKKREQQQQQIEQQQVEQQVFREHHHPIASRLLTTTTSTPTTTLQEPQEGDSSERGLFSSSVSSCPRRKRRTSSPGRARREGEKEEEKEEHPQRPSSLAIVPVRKHQKKKTIIVATSSLILFTSSLSSVFASSLPFAIKTLGSINHLYSKVSTISGHLQHLESHLLGISSWSLSNISCSSCWNFSNNITSIFSKMAGASSVEATHMQVIEAAILDQEEQQIIEDSQPAEGEASPSQERPSSAKPPQAAIKTEHEAKIHIVDSIIYNILASDSTYHTPASESIRKIYDSFSVILAEGVDITTALGDYSLITLIEYVNQASVLKSNTPWDLSHQADPISLFTVLDNINYEKFIRTGSIILEGIDDSMPYVHRHPHLFQSPLAAINFCIVDHALHRLSGKAKNHQSWSLPPSSPAVPSWASCGHLIQIKNWNISWITSPTSASMPGHLVAFRDLHHQSSMK